MVPDIQSVLYIRTFKLQPFKDVNVHSRVQSHKLVHVSVRLKMFSLKENNERETITLFWYLQRIQPLTLVIKKKMGQGT